MQSKARFTFLGAALLVISGLVSTAPVEAAAIDSHVYVNDYNPTPGQDVIIYGEGLMPNETYSVGVVLAQGDVAVSWGYFPYSVELTEATTDGTGHFRVEVEWYADFNQGVDFLSFLPTRVFVASEGSAPQTMDETITISGQITPDTSAQNGTVDLSSSPSLFFPTDTQIELTLSGFTPEATNIEVYGFYEETYQDAFEVFYGSNPGDIYAGHLMGQLNGNFNGNAVLPLQTPFQYTHLLAFLYDVENDSNRESAWLWIDASGNVEPVEPHYELGSFPTEVKPYSTARFIYGGIEGRYSLDLDKGANCEWNFDSLIFTNPGKCEFGIFDNETLQMTKHVVMVKKSASIYNSIPFEHYTFNFKARKTNLTQGQKYDFENSDFYDVAQNLFVIGNAWKEGSKSKMKSIALGRTTAVRDYLNSLGKSPTVYGTNHALNPLFKKGKLQAKNRRVEVLAIPTP